MYQPPLTPIFVSGATGYLASHIIKLLLEQDFQVRGSVRSLSNTEKHSFLFSLVPSKAQNLKLVEADLTNEESWIKALEGCEYVIHTASPIPPYVPKDENDLIIPSVNGSRNVFLAAVKNKCKKFVHTSSGLAICIGNGGKLCTEEDWSDASKCFHYAKSKFLSEKKIWELFEEFKEQIQLTVVNPTLIFGPTFTKHNNSSEALIASILKGDFPGVPSEDVGYAVVDVRDAALVHVKALFSEGSNGKRYIASKEGNLFFSQIVKVLKENFPNHHVNDKILSREEILKSGCDIAIRLLGLAGSVIKMDNTKSTKELGIEKYRDVQQSVIEMGKTLIEHKVL